MIDIFKFSTTRTIGLSIYRVVLSFLVLKSMIFYFPMASELFGPDAIFPYQDYLALMHFAHLKYLAFPFINNFLAQLFIFFTGFTAFLFLFGIFKRLSGIFLFFLLFILKQRNGFILDGSDNVIEVTLPFLVFADSYSFFKYDIPFFKNVFDKLEPKINWFVQPLKFLCTIGLMIQICYVYLFTALAKMQGALWLNGTAIYYTMRVDEFRATDWNIALTQNHYFVVLSTYFTLFWELSFSFLAWFRQTKFLIILFGITLHIGIWIFMRIDNFSWIMIGSYSIFISNDEYIRVKNFLYKKFKIKTYEE